MRIANIAVYLLALTVCAAAHAEVTVQTNDKAAMDAMTFYENSQLVVSKATVNPFELAGCLVLTKNGKSPQYLNVLPESIKKTLKPQNLTDTVYRTMLTTEQAAKVGVLGMLGISTAQKTLLEVAINERWKLEAPSFWGDNELKKTVLEVGKIYAAQGYMVSYNQNVQYSTLVSSAFQENSGEVKSAFTYVDGDGKRFVQSSNYSQRELIAVSPIDIMPVLASWNPAAVASASFKVTPSQIESLASASASFKSNVLNLNSADTNALRQFSRQLTSSDFKERLLK